MEQSRYTKEKPKPFSRFLARVLDYFFFYCFLILPLFSKNLLDHDYMHLFCIFLVPLTWLPFEILFTTLFGTTPGKAFLGIHLRNQKGKKPTFKESLNRCFSVWFKGVGLNLPLLNLFLCVKRLSEMKQNISLSWDETLGISVYYKKKRALRTVFACALVVLFSIFYVGEYELRDIINTSHQEFFSTKLLNKEKWIRFEDKNGAFVACFLSKPEEKKTKLPIPRSKESLDYTEVIHTIKENQTTFEISYTRLPKSWLKWSSSLLLKGALKVFASNVPQTKILKKSSKMYRNLPALEFILKKGSDQERSGRLVLVGDILYKLDVTYPVEKRDETQESIATFLHSFEPKL